MIRFANSNDIDEIIRLWKQCFPGEDEFDAYFFQYIFDAKQTLLLFEAEELCAMLQMIPYQMHLSDQLKDITYIYGACTAPNMRKRGYMAQLLQYSFDLDQANDRVASILIPQEKWLFAFYEKFGYTPLFFTDSSTIMKPENRLKHENQLIHLTSEHIPAISHIYHTQMSKFEFYIERSHSWWKQQIAMFRALDGEAFGLLTAGELSAVAFVWKTEEDIWIQELLSTDKRTGLQLCAALCEKYSCHSIRVTQPGDSRALGCAKFYDRHRKMKSYINLLYN